MGCCHRCAGYGRLYHDAQVPPEHLPVGVATQKEELRALFTGKPEHIVSLFTFLATELREIMAELGFRTVNEMIGQTDRLDLREAVATGSTRTSISIRFCTRSR